MATPQGAVSKLAFAKETSFGSGGTIGASSGYRLYYDSFTDLSRKDPLDFREISGLSIDRTGFEEGAITVGASVVWSMRYAGVHAALIALAMGDIDSSGSGSTFTHTMDLNDNLLSSLWIHQVPKTTNTTFVDNNMTGMTASRLVLSHQAGDVMKARLDLIGQGESYDTSPSVMPTGNNRTPDDTLISWGHKESAATSFKIKRDAGSDTQIDVRSWELTLDNGLDRNFLIQTGFQTAQPQRENFREITMRMEIEQNAGWEEFITAYGTSATSATNDFSITLDYQDPNDVDQGLLVQVANCRPFIVGRNITGPGRLYQTVEFRAHYQAAGAPIANPLRITMNNNNNGGTSGTTSLWEQDFGQ